MDQCIVLQTVQRILGFAVTINLLPSCQQHLDEEFILHVLFCTHKCVRSQVLTFSGRLVFRQRIKADLPAFDLVEFAEVIFEMPTSGILVRQEPQYYMLYVLVCVAAVAAVILAFVVVRKYYKRAAKAKKNRKARVRKTPACTTLQEH